MARPHLARSGPSSYFSTLRKLTTSSKVSTSAVGRAARSVCCPTAHPDSLRRCVDQGAIEVDDYAARRPEDCFLLAIPAVSSPITGHVD